MLRGAQIGNMHHEVQAYYVNQATWLGSNSRLEVGSFITAKYAMHRKEGDFVVLKFSHVGDFSKIYYFFCEVLDVRPC